jgi:hypothetical protein
MLSVIYIFIQLLKKTGVVRKTAYISAIRFYKAKKKQSMYLKSKDTASNATIFPQKSGYRCNTSTSTNVLLTNADASS